MTLKLSFSSALLLALSLVTGAARAGTGPGSCLEDFELVNFQPASPTFGQFVHSSSYRGRTTLVMFLASW